MSKKKGIKPSLTEKGISLLPLMVEMILWSGDFEKETEAGLDSPIRPKITGKH